MKVLLATDGSANAELAAWFLAHLPHHEKLELDVMAVIYLPDIHGSLEAQTWVAKNADAERQQAGKTLEKVQQMFQGANVVIKRHVVEGHVGKTIVEKAREFSSDLIVLGAQGHSALSRLLLGSVSDFVATHAPCSVMVVRDTGLRKENHRQLRICIGYDDSAPSRHAIQELGRFGWGKNTIIDVVSMVAFPVIGLDEIPLQLDIPQIMSSTEEMVRDATEELQGLTPNLTPHVRQCNHVGLGLSDFADEMKSDLIVVGDTGRGRLERFFLGSVSRNVLRNANCSVWIVRQRASAG
ncbi:MAG: universal stress protein [Pirellulaceae bacterium]|nr:universal stress protein [Pirellulaceae bacterium]